MADYPYRLASNRFPKPHCPKCLEPKHWQRYMAVSTGEALPAEYGRCDNATKCGHNLNPYTDGYAKAMRKQEQGIMATLPIAKRIERNEPPPKPAHAPLPFHVLEDTLDGYDENVFINNLLEGGAYPLDVEDVERVIEMYFIGTVQEGFRRGAVTFPYIDRAGLVRAVQVKEFGADNHTVGTGFIHTMIERRLKDSEQPVPEWLKAYLRNEGKVTCLFGEHLLDQYSTNPIALVEAPKTAIYATLYFGFPDSPDSLLWLAVYNLHSLTVDKCKALGGRDIILFPDLSSEGKAFKLWSSRAADIRKAMPGTRVMVSNLLEVHASEQQRHNGCDLADFLSGQDWRQFRPEMTTPSDECGISSSASPSKAGTDCQLRSVRSAESVSSDQQYTLDEPTSKKATIQTPSSTPPPTSTPLDLNALHTPAPFEIDPF
jgi:hypothetical protein